MILCWQADGAIMSPNLIAGIKESRNGEIQIGFNHAKINSTVATLIVL